MNEFAKDFLIPKYRSEVAAPIEDAARHYLNKGFRPRPLRQSRRTPPFAFHFPLTPSIPPTGRKRGREPPAVPTT
ncbi:hypothetical protein EVAR_6483_1 [Eumeta japonica]|uniref:Uncharacterized protein n=1 Tax=Eumeta variegata TaxID=151549 RepID=A0A4C1SQP9_EUMVA|nr:hypothetical protein EVAR_6483_1 [Eumeta japonica]